ncbi:outer membrane beta-barrel protein [Rheinheimera sp.]|uniref:outer membrane beta-barrel protein n=1 Tax=Rheinheimera sp. TaxID=1869214 RepID=UPI0027B8F39A|nr:outer membrane beta-barrel protein [Rheinheimera sp.]
MKQTTLAISVLLSAAFTFSAHSSADIYLTSGIYYSKVAKPINRQGSGSSLGIGYQLNNSWNFEFSYDQLIDKKVIHPYTVSNSSAAEIGWDNGYQNKGFTLSALGKTAINPAATLFYRAGIAYNDIDSMSYSQGQSTCNQTAYIQADFRLINNQGTVLQRATGCAYKDKSTDLLFGLGVEGNFSDHWFGRIEAIQYFADKGENITTAKLSIGYRF